MEPSLVSVCDGVNGGCVAMVGLVPSLPMLPVCAIAIGPARAIAPAQRTAAWNRFITISDKVVSTQEFSNERALAKTDYHLALCFAPA